MDRKEAIEYAKFRLECHTKGDGEYTDYGEFLVAAIEALQEQERKWIPVSERLPEDGYGVLVTVNGKHNNITFVDALEIAEYDGDFGWIVEGYPQWTDTNVTAWQPLPEPYKEGEQE